jgi:two-component system sensor histidine kinase KdpD
MKSLKYDDFSFQQIKKEKTKISKQMLKNIAITVGVVALATLVAFALRALLHLNESSYIITYILSVLVVSYLTQGYLYGIMASVLSVLVFNFFFTEPYYTLMAYSPEYPVTFIVMMIVSLITGTLTTRVKFETQRAELREKRMRMLYELERDLLAIRNIKEVARVAAKDVAQLFGTSVLVTVSDINGKLGKGYIEGENVFDSGKELSACMEAFRSGIACGTGTPLFGDSRAYFQPIKGQSGVLGVIGIALPSASQIPEGQRMFPETIGAQIALVIEREQMYEKQQRTQMEIERERLRGDLLRSVSHDLRTPLAGILGSASTVIENYDQLPDSVRKDFLQGICTDAEWLNHLVDNILSMTRFNEGKVILKKEMEAVEELVAGAVQRIKKRTENKDITISIPDELIMIPVEGILIEQVLVNLLDNAIKHTPENAKVYVAVEREAGNIAFSVHDNGPGISEEELPHVFNRFYTSAKQGRRGFGLGLAICKSIVEAHGGKIIAFNDPTGGAVFRFTLPEKEQPWNH